MTKKVSIAILFTLLLSTSVYAKEQKEYVSPDGKYCAYVLALPTAPYGSGESKIALKGENGKILCAKSYGSEDGEHGLGVEKAAWTPDSKFFVYSMSSSGGHQAWHFPTDFISTVDFKVRSLDDFIGSITDPDFALIAPDIIITSGRDKTTLAETNFKVTLSETVKDKKNEP
ncbi:MAG: hypothetical protein HY885_18250 [Deltaproteobacteria bacterium]|nr:hypothetical protein [Deltaproteobacteria bacterium]